MPYALEMYHKPLPTIRKPDAADGPEIWKLVQSCKPLDENSLYCNLIQCDHFRDTCVVAELDGRIVGWISAYVLPYDPQTVFVWQVAVDEGARGIGLGSLMLQNLLARDICDDVARVQTTITHDNAASWSLFRRFAQRRDGELESQAHFTRDTHFRGIHPTEYMITITLPDEAQRQAA